MKNLHDIARPGILLSGAAPGISEKDGETLRAVEMVIRSGFYSAIQTLRVRGSAERKRIGEAATAAEVILTYCVSGSQYEEGLNLSALDSAVRRTAVEALLPTLDEAREQRASTVMLISGCAPVDLALRPEALRVLADSLDALCRTAAETPAVTILIEPLDATVHKKGTLGYTSEAINLVNALCSEHANIGLCLDTSHMMLNGENPVTALRSARNLTTQLHFCNCCLNPADARYGDWHIPVGPPDPLDIGGIASILAEALDMGFLGSESRPEVFYEAQNDTMEVEEAIRLYGEVLTAAWKLVREGAET